MGLDQYSIFFIISCLSAIIMLFLAFYTWRFRSSSEAVIFSGFLLSISIWIFAIAMGMIVITPEANYWWAVLRMVMVILTPVLWFAFALQLYRRQSFINLRLMFTVSIVPIVSLIMMLTNHLHQLFVAKIQFEQVNGVFNNEFWLVGPWFWVHLVYSYILILVGDYFLIRRAVSMAKNYRRQVIILFTATIIPLVFNLSFSLHLIPQLKVNYDPLGFVIAGALFTVNLFELRLFEIKPVAQQLLIDNMRDAMVVLDEGLLIVEVNPAAELIFFVNADQIVGLNVHDLISDSTERDFLLANITRKDVRFDWSFGDEVYNVRVSPIIQKQRQIGNLLILREITHRKRLEEKLKQMAVRDSLTGLLNHLNFYKSGELELKRSKRFGHPISIIMLDIDDFKQVNDVYGHQTGDLVLKELSRLFTMLMRSTDIVSRYGGEEFAFVLPETNAEQAKNMADRLRQSVAGNKIKFDKIVLQMTVSLGVGAFHEFDENSKFDDLVHQADQALLEAKRAGKNRVKVYDGFD